MDLSKQVINHLSGIHDPPVRPAYGPHGGNIDLNHRPSVHNPDGSHSSVRSASFTFPDGRAVLVPTVIPVNGKYRVVSDHAALLYYRKTGQHLGIFPNERLAKAYSDLLHMQQASVTGPSPWQFGG